MKQKHKRLHKFNENGKLCYSTFRAKDKRARSLFLGEAELPRVEQTMRGE